MTKNIFSLKNNLFGRVFNQNWTRRFKILIIYFKTDTGRRQLTKRNLFSVIPLFTFLLTQVTISGRLQLTEVPVSLNISVFILVYIVNAKPAYKKVTFKVVSMFALCPTVYTQMYSCLHYTVNSRVACTILRSYCYT